MSKCTHAIEIGEYGSKKVGNAERNNIHTDNMFNWCEPLANGII